MAVPLPEPLTLEFALAAAAAGHPDLIEREAALARARAALEATASGDGPSVVESERWLLVEVRHARRRAILRGYFDVLLADLEHAHRNEAMAIAFVAAQRAGERNAIGQVSDIELFERESGYQQARRARFAAAGRQRVSRARLANLLNRPGELSSRLAVPVLGALDREAPDLAALENEALANNAAVKAARARVEAARRRVELARVGDGPKLSTEVESGAGTRAASGSVAMRTAELTAARARQRRVEMEVRQALLESWIALETLAADRDSAAAFAAYRDLYLERSRALHEHEVRTDLGDAMVRISESILRSAVADYELALVWARIHGLAGRDPDTLGEWLLGTGEP